MYSAFGRSDEPRTSPEGGLVKPSKGSVYSDGAWCGFCLNRGKRSWVDSDKKNCPGCDREIPKVMRIVD